MIKDIFNKYKFDRNSDRIGPDCPFTHWKLFFKTISKKLCRSKFLYFGKNAEFRPGAYAITCSKISLGNNVIIRPGTMLFADDIESGNGYIYIEDNVMLGSGVHLYANNHKFDDSTKDIIFQGYYDAMDIVLKKGCWIGANSTILAGVTIGENTVVGAGSVVTKSFPSRVLIAGNPARVIRWLDKKSEDNANK